jgi:hypothetical protein
MPIDCEYRIPLCRRDFQDIENGESDMVSGIRPNSGFQKHWLCDLPLRLGFATAALNEERWPRCIWRHIC